MKRRIAILGSTGSIGTTLLNVINKNKTDFDIVLLSANTDYKKLLIQAKKFKAKNLVINDKKSFDILKIKTQNTNIKVFNNFKNFNKIFNKKIDYTMSSISGLDGLKPTFDIIKYTKHIAIANKEAIICGWNIIKKQLIRYKTNFIPVDSEHFSIWYALNGKQISDIDHIFITASGGPFLNLPIKKFKHIKKSSALKHPNWKMGNKISVDSSTLMNKVFEIIEAKNIFNIDYKKLSILIHPKSYVHAILKFKSGLTKIILHETNMLIPIHNTLYINEKKKIHSKNLNLDKLNNLNLKKVDINKFPVIKILNLLPKNLSLFETVLVSANDKLVELFMQKKIKFLDIQNILFKVINLKEFKLLKKINPKSLKDISNLNNYVHTKIDKLIYK